MGNQKPTSEEWQSMMDAIKLELGKPAKIPEQFGEYMIDHFTNCLPPIMWSRTAVLCSEPYSFDSETEQDTFIGFYKKPDAYYGVITTIDKFKKL